MLRQIFLIFCLQLLLLPCSPSVKTFTGVCRSIEIRNMTGFNNLRNCRLVVGHVRLVHFDALPLFEKNKNITSQVEDITDYLLVYRVQGLRSLQSIFPRLKLIRGRELLFDDAALVVYENRDLVELGLGALRRIQNGWVHIENNPQLCYLYTVNWTYIVSNKTEQSIILKRNNLQNFCVMCKINTTDVDKRIIDLNKNATATTGLHCWSYDIFQQMPPRYNTTACNKNCIGNCNANGCDYCATLRRNMTCVDNCTPPMLELNKRECITEDSCYKYNYIAHAGRCLEKCPPYYQQITNTKGKRSCRLNCHGDYVIKKTEDLDGLGDCVTINGSLTIELTEMGTKIINELERAFKNVKEITGYLSVIKSVPIMSLYFLSNLDTIGGNKLIDNKYSLYVVGNHFIEEIWPPKRAVALLKGTIYFHLNPHLCHEKILDLQPQIRNGANITVLEVSRNSNGDQAICGPPSHYLNATIEACNATAVRIKVSPVKSDDLYALIGYAFFYKVSPHRNATMYHGRHGCGYDDWSMEVSINLNVRHVISNLKPFTQYAFFVKALVSTHFPFQLNAYSELNYFRTSTSKPGRLANIFAHSSVTTEIEVHWWPPLYPNGIIEKYIISHEKVDKIIPANITAPPKDCHCPALETESSGPSAKGIDYYEPEIVIYDSALSDMIYIRRQHRSLDEENEKAMDKYIRDFDLYALKMQDNGPDNFPIQQPSEICDYENASTLYQVQNFCTTAEKYDGICVPGHVHMHVLTNLIPSSTYRIVVRACVAHLSNGCGIGSILYAKTINKTMELALRNPVIHL